MQQAITIDDVVVGKMQGVGAGPVIPPHLSNVPVSQLRVVEGEVVDAAGLSHFWIDEAGAKHAVPLRAEWQPLVCNFSDELVRVGEAWTIKPWTEARKARLFAYAAAARWRREVGGISIDGMRVPTDERTQAVLTAAFARAKSDPSYAITRWKVGSGAYVELSNPQIIAIAEAVAAHVQACFDLNAEIDALVAEGEITTEAQIDAKFAAL